MSVSTQLLIEGLDPTGQTDLAAILLQLIREATVAADKGFLIVSEDTPDVVTNPDFARYLWYKRSEMCKIGRSWNSTTSSWETQTVASGTITAAMIAAGAVTLAKLYAPGTGAPVGKILQVGSSGAFELVTYAPADNSITIAKLNKATGNASKLVRVKSDDSGYEFFTLDATTFIAAAALALTKIAPGTDGQFLKTVGTTPTWITATPGFNPIYCTAINLINAVTIAVNTFTSISLAANLLTAGASTACRIAILKVYGAITEDTAASGVFNTRADSGSPTVEMLKVSTIAAGATNNVLSGHSIVFQRLTSTQSFDYQIPTATYFASGLSLDLIGYIEP